MLQLLQPFFWWARSSWEARRLDERGMTTETWFKSVNTSAKSANARLGRPVWPGLAGIRQGTAVDAWPSWATGSRAGEDRMGQSGEGGLVLASAGTRPIVGYPVVGLPPRVPHPSLTHRPPLPVGHGSTVGDCGGTFSPLGRMALLVS